MAPLPCSPVSNSTASEQSAQHSEDDSDDSLITPRPGPTDPAQRTSANLSRPSVPTFDSIPDGQPRIPFTYSPTISFTNVDATRIEPALVARERQKSVTFSDRPLSPKLHSRGSFRMNLQQARVIDEYESSADEGSAILNRKRGQAIQSSYGAVPPDQQGPSVDDGQAYDGGAEEVDSLRQRRPGSIRGKDGRTNAAPVSNQVPSASPTTNQPSGDESQRWFKNLVDKYGSVELENKGSVARDHLALERTFLAWLRTSLSFASIGVAVTQLFRLNTSLQNTSASTNGGLSSQEDVTLAPNTRLRSVGKPLGATFLGISILILLIGFHRYFESQHYVIRGKFPASRGSIILVSLLATALIVASLIVVIAVAPSAFES